MFFQQTKPPVGLYWDKEDESCIIWIESNGSSILDDPHNINLIQFSPNPALIPIQMCESTFSSAEYHSPSDEQQGQEAGRGADKPLGSSHG